MRKLGCALHSHRDGLAFGTLAARLPADQVAQILILGEEHHEAWLRGCLKSPDSVIFHRLCFPIPASKQLGRTLVRVA